VASAFPIGKVSDRELLLEKRKIVVRRVDCLVIGAGIAGASAAYELAASRQVVVLEREDRPGYHSTGRSAALFTETYGNAAVRALTSASKPFYSAPPQGFADHPLMASRGILLIGRADQGDQLDHALREGSRLGTLRRLTKEQALEQVPVFRPEYLGGGVLEPDAMDLDVDAIHQGYLRGLRQRGAALVTNAEVVAIRHSSAMWIVDTPAGSYTAPVIVNAGGAWADLIAEQAGVAPIGLVPKRRTAFVFVTRVDYAVAAWPAVIDVDETFYFKPEAGRLLGSPANEDPVEPHDVQAEELDIAFAIDRIERATTMQVARVQRRWAGLRSFVADRTPVNGFDAGAPGFYWLAAQGGYGIQTAPAMARLCAASVGGQETSADFQDLGISARALAPARLHR
jgi:D-arginine dehydrogenase